MIKDDTYFSRMDYSYHFKRISYLLLVLYLLFNIQPWLKNSIPQHISAFSLKI